MPPRLVDQYAPGDTVVIRFRGSETWYSGFVRRHEHPGIWVQTDDGRLWFVTNTRNIRKHEEGRQP